MQWDFKKRNRLKKWYNNQFDVNQQCLWIDNQSTLIAKTFNFKR